MDDFGGRVVNNIIFLRYHATHFIVTSNFFMILKKIFQVLAMKDVSSFFQILLSKQFIIKIGESDIVIPDGVNLIKLQKFGPPIPASLIFVLTATKAPVLDTEAAKALRPIRASGPARDAGVLAYGGFQIKKNDIKFCIV